jgi:hypothetical protein
VGGEDRATVTAGLVERDELLQGLGEEQRCVARDDEHRRRVVQVEIGEGREPDHHGIARAPLHPLLHEADVELGGALGLHPRRDARSAVAHHDDGPFDVEAFKRVEHVKDHGPAADDVERFRAFGPHARALARRQNDR